MGLEAYMTVSEALEMIRERTGKAPNSSYLRKLCIAGRIDGAEKRGNTWLIPAEWVRAFEWQVRRS